MMETVETEVVFKGEAQPEKQKDFVPFLHLILVGEGREGPNCTLARVDSPPGSTGPKQGETKCSQVKHCMHNNS